MANFEIVALDPATPQLRAPGASDAYTLPRPIKGLNVNYTITNISTAITIDSSYNGKIINCISGTFTITLPSSGTLDSGMNFWVINTGTGSITLSSSSATIDGMTSLILRRGEGFYIYGNGLTNWEIIGRSGLRGYSDNLTSTVTRPAATGIDAQALGRQAAAAGSFSTAMGYSAYSGATASIAIGYFTSASASYSLALGTNSSSSGSQIPSGANGATAIGGSYASGSDSFAAAIANNTSGYGAKGTSSLAMGDRAQTTATRAIAIGQQATASGIDSVAIGNGTVTATASGAMSLGFANFADGDYSLALGAYSRPSVRGKRAYASGAFSVAGDSQEGAFVLRRQTTGAATVVLTTDGGAGGSTNQITLPNASAHAFTGLVVARQQNSGGTQSAAWKIEGLIRRDGTAATTTLVASTVTVISNVPGWTVALSADTTNGCLAVTVTSAADNIRWVATIETSEVIYI